jgi:hypothetical protein
MIIAYDNCPHGMPKYILDLVPPHTVTCDLESGKPFDILVSSQLRWGITDYATIQNTLNLYAGAPFKVLVFMVSDNEGEFNVPANVILYRTSMRKSLKKPNEFMLPYIWDTAIEPFMPLPKNDNLKPRVGFCGLLSPYRIRTLQKIGTSSHIESVFILRNRFMGGDPCDPVLKEDFNNNMMNTHFNVCNRGAGNFSMRFYQTLAAGRIPVLLNTDMVLPLNINWSQYIVLADSDEEIVEKIMAFWQQGDIEAKQQRCYELWLQIKDMKYV